MTISDETYEVAENIIKTKPIEELEKAFKSSFLWDYVNKEGWNRYSESGKRHRMENDLYEDYSYVLHFLGLLKLDVIKAEDYCECIEDDVKVEAKGKYYAFNCPKCNKELYKILDESDFK